MHARERSNETQIANSLEGENEWEQTVLHRLENVPANLVVGENAVVAIQARMSSKRLPGKALQNINGHPLLGHCIARCKMSEVKRVVVATSHDAEDDVISVFSESLGVPVFRGPLDDVLERLRLLAEHFNTRHIARISGDSPFIDPGLIRLAIALMETRGVELVTNVLNRTFPKGQSVEVLSRELLQNLARKKLTAFDREHVTSYIYKNPGKFQICSFESNGDYGDVQLSVDSIEDLECARRISQAMESSAASWSELTTLRSLVCG